MFRAALAGGLGEAIWLFLTLRIGLSLFALLASFLFPLPGPCGWEGSPVLHTTGLDFRLVGVWQRWDACWYLKVATLGYRPEDPSVAFFPLYPRLIQVGGLLFGGNLTFSALVISGVAYIAAIAGLYRLLRADFGANVARRTALYLSVFPSAFFLFAPYTESLFLALAVWALYAARSGAWHWAPLLAFLVGLTRTQGILLALPLAWEFVRQWRAPGPRGARPPLAAALVPLLPLGGFLYFIVYARISTGWSALEAQSVWGQTFRAPWSAIMISWGHIRARGDVIEALNLAFLLFFAVLLVVGVRRLPVAYTLYAAPQLLLTGSHQAAQSPLMSTSRFVLVLFPAFVVLALLGRRRRLHTAWLIFSLLLLGLLVFAFMSGPFVG